MKYKVGWYINSKVVALTHFDPVVTKEDFIDITVQTEERIHEVTQPFHVLIDNRNIINEFVTSLDNIIQSMPVLNHPHLRWIIIILPTIIKDRAEHLTIQTHGHIQLRFVDSLEAAVQHLTHVDKEIDLTAIDQSFFAKN